MSPFIKEKKDYFVGIFDTRGRIVACHISGSGPGMLQPILQALPARDHAAGRRLLVQRPVHLGRRRPAPPGHGVHGAGLPRGAARRLRHHVRPLPGHRRAAGGQHLAARHRDLPRGRPRAAGADRARGAAQRGGVPDLPPQLAAARPGGGRHPRHDGLLPPGRDAPGRALRPLRRRARVLAAFDECIAQTAARARELFLQLVPPGQWRFHDFLDSDGGAEARPVSHRSHARRASGDHVRLDGSHSDDQARGPINFTTNPGLLRIAFGRYLQSLDADLEVNEGLLQNLDEWVAREGSILKPRFPAPLGMRANTRFRVMSCIFGTLAQANGGRVPAGSPVYVLYYFRAWDEARQRPILCIEGLGVGLGARPFADGVDVIYYIAQENYPVEYVERDFPLRVERYAVRPDSGGPGVHRGGTGVVRDVRVLAERAELATRMENTVVAPYGVAGGGAGRTGRITLNPGTPEERVLPALGDGIVLEARRPAALRDLRRRRLGRSARPRARARAPGRGARLHHAARRARGLRRGARRGHPRGGQDGHRRGARAPRPRSAADRSRPRLRTGGRALAWVPARGGVIMKSVEIDRGKRLDRPARDRPQPLAPGHPAHPRGRRGRGGRARDARRRRWPARAHHHRGRHGHDGRGRHPSAHRAGAREGRPAGRSPRDRVRRHPAAAPRVHRHRARARLPARSLHGAVSRALAASRTAGRPRRSCPACAFPARPSWA